MAVQGRKDFSHKEPLMNNPNNNNAGDNDDGDSSITITFVHAVTGQSESIPVPAATTTLQELTEWAGALLGIENGVLHKDGKPLMTTVTTATTLQQAGIQNGDLIAVLSSLTNTNAGSTTTTSNTLGGNSLDFSNLLSTPAASNNNNISSSGALDFSSLLSGGAAAAAAPPAPQYYPGMNLQEAQSYNPHPASFCQLLLEKEHLRKELNYYSPRLAAKLYDGISLDEATQIWRQEMVKGGIESALHATTKFHEESRMKDRLARDPTDTDAQAFFAKQDKKRLIDEQYRQVIQEYPESMGRVLMLYIAVKINGHTVQAFCDSGAQATIMSKRLAYACGLGDLIDERMAGMAVGVGTNKILGRVHICNLQIDSYWFPCTVTVMDDPPPGANEMPFLLGLDMMKRHTCLIDLEKGVLKFRLEPGKHLETPFLHEKDLTQEQGGTKGFDVNKANAEFLKASMKEDNDDDDNDNKMEEDDKKE